MTEAFAVLFTRFGIAHKTSLLYQNPLIMLSSETLIPEQDFGIVGSLNQNIQECLMSDIPKTRGYCWPTL
jgi:hypothetical protein